MIPRYSPAWRSRVMVVAGVLALATSAAGVAAADTTSTAPAIGVPVSTGSEVAQAVAARKAYGLVADPATVEALMASSADVGSAEVGIPMTRDEVSAVDINGRNAFVAAARDELIPYVRSLKTFAGVWVDQQSGGDLVVSLTSLDAPTLGAIEARAPSASRGVRVVTAKHTAATLEAAMHSLTQTWRSAHADAPLVAVGRDTPNNRLQVQITKGSGADLAGLASSLTTQVGVDMTVTETEPGDDVTCTSRDTCYGPMKAGIRIRDGSTSGGHWCTMGFLVTVNGTTDEQLLTAAHCYFDGVGTNWYHKAYGLLGSEANRSAYGHDGYDVMTVRFPDAQDSELIYGVSGPQQFTGSALPITGEGVCFFGIVDHELGYFANVAAAEWVYGVTIYR